MGNTASREVVFLLKTALDQSVNAGFSEVAQKARAAQAEISTAASKGSNARQAFLEEESRRAAKLNADAVKAEERSQEARSSALQKAMRERQRETERAVKAVEKAAKEEERINKQKWEAIERQDTKQFAASMKRIKDRESAANRAYTAERRAWMQEQRGERQVEGAVRTFAGVGKSAAMLAGMSEQDMEKMLRSLIKIQLTYDLILGAKEGVEKLQRAWHAYSESVRAAAIAHAALSAAQASGGAVGPGGVTSIGGVGVTGRALAMGRGALAGIGGLVGGGAMAGAGLLAGGAALTYGAYQLGVSGPRAAAALAERRTSLMEGGFHERLKAQEEGERNEDRVQQLERERREGRAGIERGVFQRGMSREERLRELRGPNIRQMMSGWSASMEGGGRREPGVAGYQKVEEAIAADRATGTGLTAKYEAEAAKAAQDVAAKRKAQEEAEAEAKRFREASAMSQVGATGAAMRAEENKSRWVTGTNWIHRTGSWMASWYRDNQQTEQARLEEKAAGAQTGAKGIAEVAGGREAEAKAAQVATEDALKRQQEITEKIAADKEAQAQRDIKNAEAYIGKLKEMHEAHLRNADAIEKAGRALTVQLALSKPDERRRLMRAMQHSQAGRASDKELGLLARNAAPEKAEQFEKQIEARHPEYSGLREFLGKGKSAVEAEKAKAADEEKRIKQQEEYLGKAREAAVKSADTMSNRLANVLKELFDTQERRFVEAIERMRVDFATRDRGSKALAE